MTSHRTHDGDLGTVFALLLLTPRVPLFLQVLGSHHDSRDGQLPRHRPGRRQQRTQVNLRCPLPQEVCTCSLPLSLLNGLFFFPLQEAICNITA